MSPEDEALNGRIREMQARGALMADITAALGVTKEEVWRICDEARPMAPAQRLMRRFLVDAPDDKPSEELSPKPSLKPVLAQSYFNEPRWPRDRVLRWIAFRKD